jgi:hypothetical protein
MSPDNIQLIIQGGFGAVVVLLLWWQHQERRDMAKRIRQLEESRASELKEYAEKVTTALINNTRVMQSICDVLRSRPCLADAQPRPQDIPEVTTDTLTRKIPG